MQDLTRYLPAVIFEYAFNADGNHRFTFVSEASADIVGIAAADLIKNPSLIKENIDRHDTSKFEKAFSRASNARNECLQLDIFLRGEIKKIEFRYSDQMISERAALRRGIIIESQSPIPARDESLECEHLFEKLPIGVVIHHKGIVQFANAHAHCIVAAKPGQLKGYRALDFVHPDYSDRIEARIKEVTQGRPVPMEEEKFICMDGREIDVETMAFPFTYKGKSCIQVIFRDITEKKTAEAQVRKHETLFTQLFQNVPMAVVMLDESGRVSEINSGFQDMFGFAEYELRGRNLNDFIVPEDLRSEGIDLNKLITSNRVVSIESIRKHKSGKHINVILCGVPVIFENEAIGIYGVYVDISDRKKVEEELKVRNAELDNFVYKVSHDLRAPLSSILGLVNLSRLQGNTDNPLEYMELIGEKIQALDNFIGDVLSHSKNLNMDVNIGEVDLKKIIEQTFMDLGYLKGARQTKRSVKIEGIEFYSDQWRVSEIFRNLISNAIKYRRPDADDSEIGIKINVNHLCAEITFADNGIGIKEESLKRIFEMFYRATDQGDGSGIGLYIVKNAVEKLGGQVKVASQLGKGTRFHILLPNRISTISKEGISGQ